MNELIAKRYAVALMEIVSEKDLGEQLELLREILKAFAGEEFREIIASPLVPDAKKFEMLIAPLEEKLDRKFFRLLQVMSEKGRLDLLPDLEAILAFELKKRSNSFEGHVESDEALSEEEIGRLEKVLEKYSGASISLKQTGQQSDGLRVTVEDLGLELGFSKARIKSDLLDFIQKAL